MNRSDKQVLAGAAGINAVATASTVLVSPDGLGPEGVKQISLITAVLFLIVTVQRLGSSISRWARRIIRATRAQTDATRNNTAAVKRLIDVVTARPEPAEPEPASRGRIALS